MNEHGDIGRCHIPEGQNYTPKCQKYDGETQYFQCRKGKWCHIASDCPTTLTSSISTDLGSYSARITPVKCQQGVSLC